MVKKLFYLFLILLIAGVAGLWYVGNKQFKQQGLNASKGDLATQLDTDHDNLKDWEEHIWQTDPNKPDTDGDGTNDGAEVEQKRDPTKAGPNDKLVDSYAQATAQIRNTLNETSGPVINVEPADIAQPSAQYNPADLHITLKDTRADATTYGNNYRRIIADLAASTTANIPQLLFAYLTDGDQSKLAQINQAKIVYASTVRRLLDTPITLGATYWHLNLINSLAGLTELIYNIGQADTIPSLALASARLYPSRYLLVVKSLLAMNKYFAEQKVTFTDGPVPLILINNF